MPTSPLLAGVTSFNGGSSSYRNDTVIAPGAVLIANWEDEFPTPFEAYTDAHAGCVVALNFYPPSSDARADFWDATTDGWVLQANALNFTCTTPPPPEPPPTTTTPQPAPTPAATLILAPRFTGLTDQPPAPPLRRASASRRPCRTPSPAARRRPGC